MTLLYLIPSIVLAAIGMVLLKQGASKIGIKLVLGLLFLSASMAFYLLSLRTEQLSVVYSVGAMTHVLVIFMSFTIMRERISDYKWVGIIFIILGSFFVVR
ncbi:MAG: EamA family transporter [Nanoarchaeota archaeon]|nr:EamA family transporter [Nanoarchaeota archaeon]